MTHPKAFVAFSITVALAVGCKPTPENPAPDTKQQDNASVQLANAKADTKAAVQAMAEYSYAKKAEFLATMNKDLVSLQEDLDRLSAKIESSGGAAKADAKAKLETIRGKLSQTKNLFAQAESATESTWNGATGGFRQAYADLRGSIEETRKWLSDKIAP